MTLAELRARLEAVKAELRQINTDGGDADLSPEAQARWVALEAEHATVGASIETEERSERIRESRKKFGAPYVAPAVDDDIDLRRAPAQAVRDAARRFVDKRENSYHLTAEQRTAAAERVEKLVRTQSGDFNGQGFARYMLATETEHYRSAFQKIMAGGSQVLTPAEADAVNTVHELRVAMSVGSDANGGFAVPILIDPTLILTAQGHPNDFFNISRVEDITNDEWRGLTTAGATSFWTTEATTVTGGEPVIAQPTVPTRKLTTYVKYSFEVGGDWPSFASQMQDVMAESQSEALVAAFTNGLGTTAQPTGLITKLKATAGSQVLVTTDGAMGATDFYRLWQSLPIRFRNNARWMANTSVLNGVRQFATGANNSDANFTVNVGQETVDRLFGKPVHYNDYMDNLFGTGGVTSASDVGLAVVGDFRQFLIARRVGATVETVQHVIDTTTGNPTGQRGTLMWSRYGSDAIVPNAFRLLTND